MDNMELGKLIQEGFTKMNERFDKVDKEIEEVKKRLYLLERTSTEDIYTLVKDSHKATKNLVYDVELLSDKVNYHEKLLNRVTKQLEA